MDVENVLTGLAETHRVVDVHHGVVEPDIGGGQNHLDDLIDEPLGCQLPFTVRHLGKSLGSDDGQPILL